MSDVLESSVIVRALRRLGPITLLGSIDRAIAQAVAEKASSDDASRVRAVVAESRLVRTCERIFEAPALAWRYSRVRPAVEGTVATLHALDVAQRVRLMGWMMVVATVTRACLAVGVGNRPSLVTLGIVGAVVAVGVIVMAASAPIGEAWVEWRRHRGRAEHNARRRARLLTRGWRRGEPD